MSQAPSVRLYQYHYDPLDRLASRSSSGQAAEHSFYLANRLATQVQGPVRRSWLHGAGQLLAQQRTEAGATHCTLIATDAQGSVLRGLGNASRQAYAYAAYGERHPAVDPLHLPGFNREVPDPLTGHYLLGNGYRAFNPVLMRFNSPDSLSPFGEGGVNAYAYCAGNPVNRADPDGHLPIPYKVFVSRVKSLDIEQLRATREIVKKYTTGTTEMESGLKMRNNYRGAFISEAKYWAERMEIRSARSVGESKYTIQHKTLLKEVAEQQNYLEAKKGFYRDARHNKGLLDVIDWSDDAPVPREPTKVKWSEDVVEPSTRHRREFRKTRDEIERIRQEEARQASL